MRENYKIIYYDDGRKIIFFHSAGSGLCIDSPTGVQVLLDDAYRDYDVCKLCGELYLVCQNMQGDLIFLKYFDSKWHKYTLLMSKTRGAYEKNFFLLPTGSCVQLFYTINSGGKKLLVQQLLGEGAEPVIVAAVQNCAQPFYAVLDSELNTYIYYQSENNEFGCKMYKWSSKALGEFRALSKGACEHIYAAIDPFGRHHVCFVREKFIVYLMRANEGTYDDEALLPHVSDMHNAPPYITFKSGKTYIVWQQQKNVMYAVRSENTGNFSAPVRIMSTAAEPIMFGIRRNNERSMEAGYFSGKDLRFFNVGTGTKNMIKSPSLPIPDRRFIQHVSGSGKEENSSEIVRLKSAVGALGREVSVLKNKLEMALSFIENSKNG